MRNLFRFLFPKSWRRRMAIGLPILFLGVTIMFLDSEVFMWVGGAIAVVGLFVIPYTASPGDD